MKKGKIRLIGSPPGSGKSAVREALKKYFPELYGEVPTWLLFEHEQVFTPEMRVKTATLANVEMSSKDFVINANLPGQMAFQGLLRDVADNSLNVTGFGPFENVWGDVGGQALYRKLETVDFAGYDFKLLYFLVLPDGRSTWTELSPAEVQSVEEEIQRRLLSRKDKSPYDADKVGVPDYYSKRATNVQKSADAFGLQLLPYGMSETVEAFAKKLGQAIIES